MTWNPSGSEAGAVRQDATDALRRAGFHAAAAELDCRQPVYWRNLFRRAIAEARSFERAMTRVGQIAPARPTNHVDYFVISGQTTPPPCREA